MTQVRGHYRNGRWVRPHVRRGGRIAASVGLGAVGLGAVVGSLFLTNGEPRAEGVKTQAVVTRIIDGDTLVVAGRDGKNLGRVRLVGIDAPEVTQGECYSRAATRLLSGLTPTGTAVALITDPAQDDRDRYTRLLRFVMVDGEDVGMRLVAAGGARVMPVRGWDDAMIKDYAAAQRVAQDARKGLWGSC